MPFINYICHSPYQMFGGISDIIPRIGESVRRQDDIGGDATFYKVKDVMYDIHNQDKAPDHLAHTITVELKFHFRTVAGQPSTEVPS